MKKSVFLAIFMAVVFNWANAQSINSLTVDSVKFPTSTQCVFYGSWTGLTGGPTYGAVFLGQINPIDTNTVSFTANTTNGNFQVSFSGLIPGQSYVYRPKINFPFVFDGQIGTFIVPDTSGGNNSCNMNVAITPTGPISICPGSVVSMKIASVNFNYAYQWKKDGINIIGAIDTIYTAMVPGIYTVVADSGNCTTLSNGVVINSSGSQPVATISGNLSLGCTGSTTLTAGGGSTYIWSTGSTSTSITVTTAGTYKVTATNSCGVDSTSVIVTNTITSIPVNLDTSGVIILCPGNSITFTATSVSGASLKWYKQGTPNMLIAQTGSCTVNTPGNYFCEATLGSCTGTSAIIAVVQGVVPSGTILSNPAPSTNGLIKICQGDSAVLSAPMVTGYTYLWSTGSTSNQINAGISGVYGVSVTSDDGCSIILQATVQVNSLPSGNIVASPPSGEVCQGENLFLTAPTGSGYSYLWSNGSVNQILQISTSVVGTSVFSVIITNNNDCQKVFSDTVKVNEIPTANIQVLGNPTFCEGGSVDLKTFPNNANYLWSTGETTQVISVSDGGIYNVTVTKDGCSNFGTSPIVTVNDTPHVTISSPSLGSLLANVSFGTMPYSYSWNPGGATTQNIIAFSNGVYSVMVTDLNGCTGNASTSVFGVGIEEIIKAIENKDIEVVDILGRFVYGPLLSNTPYIARYKGQKEGHKFIITR